MQARIKEKSIRTKELLLILLACGHIEEALGRPGSTSEL